MIKGTNHTHLTQAGKKMVWFHVAVDIAVIRGNRHYSLAFQMHIINRMGKPIYLQNVTFIEWIEPWAFLSLF